MKTTRIIVATATNTLFSEDAAEVVVREDLDEVHDRRLRRERDVGLRLGVEGGTQQPQERDEEERADDQEDGVDGQPLEPTGPPLPSGRRAGIRPNRELLLGRDRGHTRGLDQRRKTAANAKFKASMTTAIVDP